MNKSSRFSYPKLIVAAIIAVVAISFTINYSASKKIIKSENDSTEYAHMTLNNGLQIIVASDPKAEKAAATLAVGVGSYHEPNDWQGLAHFLEHMLFLGTKKYPDSGEYHEFIKHHGGFDNAWTANDHTAYYFEILPNHFDPALDRFAQFFISPLFNEDLVERERNAVHSEYQLHVKNDDWREYSAFKQAVNPDHPLAEFSVGSLQTLADKEDQTTRDRLIKFYQENYSADNMYLALVGPQSLNELKNMVAKYFTAIEKKPTKIKSIDSLPLTAKQLGSDLNIASVGDKRRLTLSFPIPSQRTFYQDNPVHYVTKILSATHGGGLEQYLKDKNWITDLEVNHAHIDEKQDIVELAFNLTKSGRTEIDAITAATLHYTNWVAEHGIEEWYFKQQVATDVRNFKFAETYTPERLSQKLAVKSLYYPAEHVLSQAYLTNHSQFKPELIQGLLGHFTASNLLRTLLANDVKTDQIETYYNVPYRIKSISSENKDHWKQFAHDGWKMPQANELIPYELDLLPIAEHTQPTLVEYEKRQFWLQTNQSFKQPKVVAKFTLRHPAWNDTAQHDLYTKFFLMSLDDKADALSSQLDDAGTNISYQLSRRDLVIEFNGFRDRQDKVIQTFLQELQNWAPSAARFDSIKEKLKQDLINYRQQYPFRIAFADGKTILSKYAFHPDTLLSYIDTLNLSQAQRHIDQILAFAQIEAFFTGNLDQANASELLDTFQRGLHTEGVLQFARTQPIDMPILTIEQGQDLFWQINPLNQAAGATSVLYQAEGLGDAIQAKAILLADIMRPSMFEELRTKQQLGYAVFTLPVLYENSAWLGFAIESPNQKSATLLNRMETFIEQFLTEIQQAKLATHKQSVRDNLLEKPKTLSELSEHFYPHIRNHTYRFDKAQQLADAVDAVTLEELVDFYQSLLINPKTRKRLVVATADTELQKVPTLQKIGNLVEFKHKAKFIDPIESSATSAETQQIAEEANLEQNAG